MQVSREENIVRRGEARLVLQDGVCRGRPGNMDPGLRKEADRDLRERIDLGLREEIDRDLQEETDPDLLTDE